MDYKNLIIVMCVGICAGMCGLCVAFTFQVFDAKLNTLACFGAFTAGLICSPLFGCGGISGWFNALLCGIAVTLFGSVLSIMALLLLEGGLFSQLVVLFPIGIALVISSIVTQPITLTVWFAFMGVAHMLAFMLKKWRNFSPHWSELN